MPIVLFVLLLTMSWCGVAQENFKPTSSFSVTGKVKSTKTFTIHDIRKVKSVSIGDVAITNHKGEAKGTAKAMEGVLLKDILATLEIDAESPKVLSEYYFVCIASDGYKVVYSWNELFNTKTGDSVYIVTSKDDQSIETLAENILMVSTQDARTGRRYLKNLQEINVGRAE